MARKHTESIEDDRERCHARQRYERIAEALYCGRSKRPSIRQRERAEFLEACYVHSITADEVGWIRDLSAVANDYKEPEQGRKRAARHLHELEQAIEARQTQAWRAWVAATRAPGFSKPIAPRWLRHVARLGFDAWFDQLRGFVQRYSAATWRGERSPRAHPLLELIAQEFVRDDEVLRSFFEASFAIWGRYSNPESTARKSSVMHQCLGSPSFLRDCDKANVQPLRVIGGAIASQTADQLYGSLNTQKTREIQRLRETRKQHRRKDRAKRTPVRVTIR